MMKIHNIALGFFMLLLVGLMTVKGQEKDFYGKYSIKTDKGFLFGYNSQEKSFTFEINGKSVKPLKTGDNPGFMIDGKVFQVLIVGIESFVPYGKKLNEEETLQQHLVWEVDYLSGEYETQLKAESEKIALKDRKMLFWSFTRPKYNKEFDRDYFLTTLIGNDLLGISVSTPPGENAADVKKMMTGSFETLKISDKPFDIKKLADEIKNN